MVGLLDEMVVVPLGVILVRKMILAERVRGPERS